MSESLPVAAPGVLDLSIPDAGAAFHVHSFRGRERLSRPYTFAIRARTELDGAGLSGLPGCKASFAIDTGEHRRAVHGVVRRVALEAHPDDPSRRTVRVWLAPRLWLLGQGRHSRIFQDRTVAEIADVVLGEAGVDRRWSLLRRYEPRRYCVQHQESDLAFLARILAEEGIFYWFEGPADPAGDDALVLADDATFYPRIAGAPSILFRPESGMNAPGEHVRRFGMTGRVRPERVLIRQFDFTNPRRTPTGRAGDRPEDRTLRVYDHKGEFEGALFDDAVAEQHLEQHRSLAQTYSGESRSVRLAPGRAATLEGHPEPGFDQTYAVVGVEHEGHAPEEQAEGEPGRAVYENRFTCVRGAVPFRPPRPPRRIQQVLETATVVGPEGEEIHTDALGRVMVQFHWDTEGRFDERSSCWIRVMQPWAGAGFGAQFLPRVGMEVLVSFVHGDTDTPVVLGSVYNADHPLPFPVPENKTKSGLRTRSSVGGEGANELSFEDRRGAEKVYLHAERDLEERVENDHRETVGRDGSKGVDRDHTVRVGRNQVVIVGGDQVDHVARQRFEIVDGNRYGTVGGRQIDTVARDHVERAGGDHVVWTAGLSSETVGTSEDPSAKELHVWGDYSAGASENVRIRAEKSVVIECGDTRLELGPDHARLRTPSLTLVGDKEAYLVGKGATLRLSDTADLGATRVKLVGSKAGLLLDQEARLAGPHVHLGGSLTPRPTEEQIAGTETQTVRVRMADYDFNPYADKHYELTCEGVVYAGKTGGDGTLEERVPRTAKQATLVLWKEAYPTGRRGLYHLRLGETLPAPSTPRGALLRLGHLGYHRDAPRDELDEGARRWIRAFQEDHGIEQSGELDDQTAAKIREAHGS